MPRDAIYGLSLHKFSGPPRRFRAYFAPLCSILILCYNFCHLKGMTTMPPVLQAIDNMTSAEKIQTMDYLWTALEASSNDYTPPAWHARELARRRALYEAGKVPVYDWTEVKARLDARRNAR